MNDHFFQAQLKAAQLPYILTQKSKRIKQAEILRDLLAGLRSKK